MASVQVTRPYRLLRGTMVGPHRVEKRHDVYTSIAKCLADARYLESKCAPGRSTSDVARLADEQPKCRCSNNTRIKEERI